MEKKPQGIDESHISSPTWHRHASPALLLALAILLGMAFAGLFAGYPHPRKTIDTDVAKVDIEVPERLRNGEFFEMRIMVRAKRPIEDLTLAISAEYWREMTINTMLPAPEKESSANGKYRFSYGPVKTGEKILIKFDGQINPPLFAGTTGSIAIFDGEAPIATLPVSLKVMP